MTHEQAQTYNTERSSAGRAAGITIGLGSIIMPVFMALHPTVESHAIAGFVDEVSRESVINGIVHATLMGTMGLLLLGFLGFAERLGMHVMAVRAGFIAYAMGAVALIAAALVNGFIVPALASRYSGVESAALEGLRPLLVLCHETNGALDRLGIIAMSAGVLLWSLVLAQRPGASRVIGIFGLIVSAAPPILLIAGHLPMNVHGFGAFVVTQGIWYLAIAVQLVRGRI